MNVRRCTAFLLVGLLFGLLRSGTLLAEQPSGADGGTLLVAQASGTDQAELRPRYQPVPAEEKGWYNDAYIFGMTRGVAGSTIVPALKAPLFLFTVPLDIVLLPVAAIGGLFG